MEDLAMSVSTLREDVDALTGKKNLSVHIWHKAEF